MECKIRSPEEYIYYSNSKVTKVVADEVDGVLYLEVILETGEEFKILYEGMYYSEIDESFVGKSIEYVKDITPLQMKSAEYLEITRRLCENCCIDFEFIEKMYCRGNKLFVHKIKGEKFIVLAKGMEVYVEKSKFLSKY